MTTQTMISRRLFGLLLCGAVLWGCSNDKGGVVAPPGNDATDSQNDGGVDGGLDGDDDSADGDADGTVDGDADTDVDTGPELGDLGDECVKSTECKSSLCVELQVLDPDRCADLDDDEICGFCSQACESNADCAGTSLGLVCNDYQAPGGAGDYIKACVQRPDVSCSRCENGDGSPNINACSPSLGNQCLSFVDGHFCTLNCNGNPDICPEGTQCIDKYFSHETGEEVEFKLAQCVPEENQCTDCYDPDGDGYGLGEGCLGIDCDETNTNINAGATEICDLAGVDYDCDGSPIPQGMDFTTDVNNCGGCQIACTPNQAEAFCADSQCGIAQCNEFYYDLNEEYADGCEYECIYQDLSVIDVPDMDRRDTDCDGIDGASAEAIFVSAAFNANNANPGTRDAPVRDVWKGIELAEASGKSQVLVTSGTFNGPAQFGGSGRFVMKSGISVYGGYSQGSWQRDPGNNITVLKSTSPETVSFRNITAETTLAGVTVQGTSFTGSDARSTYAIWIEDSGANVTLEELIVQAGNAAKGANGSAGSTGPAGNTGGSAVQTTRGAGGSSLCGATGGNGGNGVECDTGSYPGAAGSAGTDRITGQPFARSGGEGGSKGQAHCKCGVFDGGMDQDEGGPGGAGRPGNDGAQGGGGAASGNGQGSFTRGAGFTGGSGSSGTNGVNGTGGGGGGSGGSDNDQAVGCKRGTGGGGGGGGAGGCGGEGGGPGTAGGGSFGLVVISSTVTSRAVSIDRGSGGAGGAGGTGGDGGAGAGPGSGFNIGSSGTFQTEPGTGGSGGPGGKGGAGGGGAGGCGGASIGVALVEGATITQAEINVQGGSGGAGGDGGLGGKRDGVGARAESGAKGCGGALEDFVNY